MAEAKAKIVRSNCLRNFTRSENQFNEAHAQNLPLDLVTKAFDKLQTCYDKLEAAQDAFTLVAEEEEAVDYLANAGNSYQTALVKFGVFKKKAADDKHIYQREVAENNEKQSTIGRREQRRKQKEKQN